MARRHPVRESRSNGRRADEHVHQCPRALPLAPSVFPRFSPAKPSRSPGFRVAWGSHDPGLGVGRVGAGGCPPAPPSEPYVKVSLHTAQVFIRRAAIGLTRGDGTPLGRTGTQPPRRCAPLGHSFETHQPTGVGRHLRSQRTAVRGTFLPFQTRPTWAYPVHYAPALASSVLPMLLPGPALR